MTTARETIAQCLTEQPAFGFTDRNRLQGADVILSYLREAGYVIIRDRTDPEGGIPGRQS
jgi:hypothetical protein